MFFSMALGMLGHPPNVWSVGRPKAKVHITDLCCVGWTNEIIIFQTGGREEDTKKEMLQRQGTQ